MADERIVVLLRRRMVIKQKLTRLENAVEGLSDATSRAFLEVQLEHADKIEEDVLAFEEDLLSTVLEDAFESNAAECTILVDRCSEIKAKLKGLIQPTLHQATQDVGVAAPVGSGVRIQNGVNLPRLEIPKFSGILHEWTSFRDRFSAAIHCKADDVLAGSQKLEYLKASLSGEAADLISSIQLTDANYLIAWNLLVKRYENKRQISRAHLDRLIAQDIVTPGCGQSLRALVDRTHECIRCLAALGAPVGTWDILVCRLIERKLDPETRQQWELTFCDGSFPDLAAMLEFLDRRARSFAAIELVPSFATAGGVNESSRPTHHVEKKAKFGHSPTSCNLGLTNKCAICGDAHAASECSKLLEAGPADRMTLVARSRLCFVCLSTGHLARRCNAERCSLCKGRHHILLHVDGKPAEFPKNLSSNHSCSEAPHMVLLPTAVVQVEDTSGSWQSIRSLIDCGSQASFIKESCIRKLNSECSPAEIQITGIGQSSAMCTKGKVQLRIRSHCETDFELTVTAYVIPEVTGYQPTAVGDSERQHFQGVTLADAQFDQMGEIELLLGADARGSIIRAGVLTSDIGNLYGELTAFGWTVSGLTTNGSPHDMLTHHAHFQPLNPNQRNAHKRKLTAPEEVISKCLKMIEI